jgi:hypothetical protein
MSVSKDKRIMAPHKRSFDEFAEPLPPLKWGRPYLHNNKPNGTPLHPLEPIKPNMMPFYNHATKETPDQHATVNNFIIHGMNPERFISRLTNEIHPIFRKICRCKFTHDYLCLNPEIRYNFEKRVQPVQVPEIASPIPPDNFIVRTMVQLATHILTSDDSLQFISALMDCGWNGVHFHVHSRKHLSAE